jgi:hypothetical protein
MNTAVLPAPRIFERPWTREQLLRAAEAGRDAEEHSEYRSAARVMARRAQAIDLLRIRVLVSDVMGGTAGTYYICGALQSAHLAISFPDLFTARQLELLLAPLTAVEQSDWENTRAAA